MRRAHFFCGLVGGLTILVGLGGLSACGSVQPDPAAALARRAASTVSATSSSTTLTTLTTLTASTTSTTVDPGSLAQTADVPATSSPTFNAHVQALWQAIVDGTPDEALPFFFPRSAYLQVKAIRDPAGDWQTRLIANFDQDIAALHRALGTSAPGATLLGIDVPANGVWIGPGVEFNRLSYWRVYGTEVRYQVAGVTHRFPIASMISWRGEWYVVHLFSIR